MTSNWYKKLYAELYESEEGSGERKVAPFRIEFTYQLRYNGLDTLFNDISVGMVSENLESYKKYNSYKYKELCNAIPDADYWIDVYLKFANEFLDKADNHNFDDLLTEMCLEYFGKEPDDISEGFDS